MDVLPTIIWTGSDNFTLDLSELWLKCGTKFPSIEFMTNFSYLIVFGWYTHGAISNISTEKELQFQTSGDMESKKVSGRPNNRILCALQSTVWFRSHRTNSCFKFSLFILYRSASGQSNDVGFMLSLHDLPSLFGKQFSFRDFVLEEPQTGLHAVTIRWTVDIFGHLLRIPLQPFAYPLKPSVILKSIRAVKHWTQ